jgi:hypothetical protein
MRLHNEFYKCQGNSPGTVLTLIAVLAVINISQ